MYITKQLDYGAHAASSWSHNLLLLVLLCCGFSIKSFKPLNDQNSR